MQYEDKYPIQEGTEVYKLNDTRGSKLEPYASGPYKVVRPVGHNTVLIEHSADPQNRRLAHSRQLIVRKNDETKSKTSDTNTDKFLTNISNTVSKYGRKRKGTVKRD